MSEVTDRMVEAAMSAWLKCPEFSSGTYNAMRAAIEAALREMPAPEPVASLMTNIQSGDVEVVWNDDGFDRALWVETPLYTHPPQQRKPLTDEEIDRITDQQWAANNHKPVYAAHRAYARAVERAHGIGGEKCIANRQ